MEQVVFKNKNNKTLVYYPVPKNANTSVKSLFASILGIENKFDYRDGTPRYKRPSETMLLKSGAKPSISSFFKNYEPFVELNVDIKICIVRDPLERFISAYENRVLFHRDRGFQDYRVDKVLEELINGNFENKHFLPQTYFLGSNLKYFTHVYKIYELNLLYKNLIDFFDINMKLKIPHLQTGRSKKITLNKFQIKKIKNIYKKDYILLNKFF